MLSGFSRLLFSPLFSALQKVAEEGPVRYSCDSSNFLSVQDPVPLDIALTNVSELSSEFQFLAGYFGYSYH